MLVALDRSGNRVLSSMAKRNRSYYCQQCGKPLIFKKGKIKIPHFAHYPSKNPCFLWESESSRHLEMKYILMDKIINYNNCTFAEYEYNIDGFFPDLFFKILDWQGKEWKIAVECQISNKSYEDILFKTRFYSERDIYVLWVLDFPSKWLKKVSRMDRDKNYLKFYETKVNSIHLNIHQLYSGKIYFLRDEFIMSCHLYDVFKDRKYWNRRINEYVKFVERLKTKKKPVVKILDNFRIRFYTSLNNLKLANFSEKQFWIDK